MSHARIARPHEGPPALRLVVTVFVYVVYMAAVRTADLFRR